MGFPWLEIFVSRTAALVYPHQLFDPHPALVGAAEVVLVEDPLIFRQYWFHRQKLILHRASLQAYAAKLRSRGHTVRYLDSARVPTTQAVAEHLAKENFTAVRVVELCDDWLDRRLSASLKIQGIALERLDDPHFLTPPAEVDRFVGGKSRLFFTEFYIAQRKRLNILIDNGKPIGGQWSFDPENRRKLPKGIVVPETRRPAENDFVREARDYVRRNFPDAIGSDEPFGWPIDHAGAAQWLDRFIAERLDRFGDYEDAISSRHEVLFHSALTPMLNIGLLSPRQVLDAALKRANDVPMNSLEGFIRQVCGWREFVRLVYLRFGRNQRIANHWNHTRPIPKSFYDGTTGIEPVDHVIRQVLRTGYCHHIERLMILGNFLMLCEVHPVAVCQWFMELFVDAYDWVMVPNVHGMSQHSDGGFMTTKPYISGSSYVLKMSDFKKGPWCEIWDALYWRFVDKHVDFFAANPRTAMIAKLRDKLGDRLKTHRRVAEAFLAKL
ncbi:MAG: cryptochrome/photolyase family protein [Planctomycetia bacterium]|nr:cryptochrome/photolyase family protein [Planctomycetia bacterium]